MKLASFSFAWIAGIYFGSMLSPPLYAFIPSFALPLIVILLLHKRRNVLWGGLFLIVLLGGLGCYGWRTSEATLPSYLEHYNEQHTVEIRGTVTEDPQCEDNFARINLSVEGILTNGEWREVSGNVLTHVLQGP